MMLTRSLTHEEAEDLKDTFVGLKRVFPAMLKQLQMISKLYKKAAGDSALLAEIDSHIEERNKMVNDLQFLLETPKMDKIIGRERDSLIGMLGRIANNTVNQDERTLMRYTKQISDFCSKIPVKIRELMAVMESFDSKKRKQSKSKLKSNADSLTETLQVLKNTINKTLKCQKHLGTVKSEEYMMKYEQQLLQVQNDNAKVISRLNDWKLHNQDTDSDEWRTYGELVKAVLFAFQKYNTGFLADSEQQQLEAEIELDRQVLTAVLCDVSKALDNLTFQEEEAGTEESKGGARRPQWNASVAVQTLSKVIPPDEAEAARYQIKHSDVQLPIGIKKLELPVPRD